MTNNAYELSNEDFIQDVFGNIEIDNHLWVCTFSQNPGDGNWSGEKQLFNEPINLSPNNNNYFSVSVLRGGARNSSAFVRMAVLVGDDANPDELALPPSYVIETSPGKFQVGYMLLDDEFSRDPVFCTKSLKAMAMKGLVDRSGNNNVRYVRLPVGANNKYDEINKFKQILQVWSPEKRYSLPEALKAFGVGMDEHNETDVQTNPENPKSTTQNLKAFRDEEAKKIKSALNYIPSADYDQWIQVGMALHHSGLGSDQAFGIWAEWSESGGDEEGFDLKKCKQKWKSFSVDVERDFLTTKSIFHKARERGWRDHSSTPTLGKGTRTAAEILEREFEPIKWAIPQILPEGVYILAAAPKVGKSWLALQFAVAVATGSKIFGEEVEKGAVLYLALEDSDRRIQSRLRKFNADLMYSNQDLSNLHFETEWPKVDQDGAEKLELWLSAHPDTKLVIVDVFERFRPERQAKANPYSEDYEAMKIVKSLAEVYRTTFLIVHHTRKNSSDDPLGMVSGTQGLAGGADGVLVIERGRDNSKGALHVIGRDLEREGAFAFEFVRESCQWEMLGTASEVASTERRQDILDLVKESGKMTATQVNKVIGKTLTNTCNLLKKLTVSGHLRKEGDFYMLNNELDLI